MTNRELAAEISSWIQEEARQSKMLPKTPAEILYYLESGRGQVVLHQDGHPAAFAAYDEWTAYREVCAVIVRPAWRHLGLGSRAVKKAIVSAQGTKPLIAFTNEASAVLFRKFGFRNQAKTTADQELWLPCRSCNEHPVWPACHCQFMQLQGQFFERGEQNYSVIDLITTDEADMAAAAALYCRVWQEPPWLEMNWRSDEVQRDFEETLQKPGSHAFLAVSGRDVVGFSSGWTLPREDLTRRSAGKPELFGFDGRPIFYIAELASSGSRRHLGIGRNLLGRLLEAAGNDDHRQFLTRTHVDAEPARRLYSSLGFEETVIADIDYQDRTYWVRR